MRDEEVHAEQVYDLRQMAELSLEKERSIMLASWARQRAVTAVRRVRALDEEVAHRELMLGVHKDAIEEALMRTCLAKLKQMNIITGESIMEQDWCNVLQLRRLINSRHPTLVRLPNDYDAQGLRDYFDRRTRHRNERNAQWFARAYAMFHTNVSQDSIQGRQQREMAAELAGRLEALGWEGIDTAEVQQALTPRSMWSSCELATIPDPTPRIPGRSGYGRLYMGPGGQFNS
eukprot:TRINITY_DN55166_c0_g1_i2.p1 TRINITY_DN55166_c0_g1~~TRINITY_DN55166_c0_g1_i2.p1  ORF type:complete len:232 (-),score=50.28 TRINITY_DN55166_c0_g1_i2:233-928(-)